MTRGTITNRKTGQTLTGDRSPKDGGQEEQ